jgi:choline-glycine betaine transporter
MRTRFALALSVYALPLAIVLSLALLGIIFSKRAYVIFAGVHLLVVSGVLWFILKDMEKKIDEAIGEVKRARRP